MLVILAKRALDRRKTGLSLQEQFLCCLCNATQYDKWNVDTSDSTGQDIYSLSLVIAKFSQVAKEQVLTSLTSKDPLWGGNISSSVIFLQLFGFLQVFACCCWAMGLRGKGQGVQRAWGQVKEGSGPEKPQTPWLLTRRSSELVLNHYISLQRWFYLPGTILLYLETFVTTRELQLASGG